MDFQELIMRHAMRNDYRKIVKLGLQWLTPKLHLEYAFFIMKQIVKDRHYSRYEVIRELANRMALYNFPTRNAERDVCRIERAAAYVVSGFCTSLNWKPSNEV